MREFGQIRRTDANCGNISRRAIVWWYDMALGPNGLAMNE
jgi:hypothetical protein